MIIFIKTVKLPPSVVCAQVEIVGERPPKRLRVRGAAVTVPLAVLTASGVAVPTVPEAVQRATERAEKINLETLKDTDTHLWLVGLVILEAGPWR